RFFSERRVGELSSRISSDLSQIQDTISFTLAEFLRGLVTLVVGMFLIFFISAQLAFVMLSIVPVIAVLAVVFGARIRKMARKGQDQLADSGNIINEALMGINNVKTFTNERFEINRYGKSINSVVSTAIANARFRGAFVSLLIFSVFGAIAVVIWYGAGLIQKGEFDAGKLTTFVIYTAFVGGTMAGFADMFSQLQKTIGATQRVREILREQGESIDLVNDSKEIRISGAVRFQNVEFAYPSRKESMILKGLNLDVSPGQLIAIVGSSGAGKSTIASLLLRFYDPISGQIYIDNKPSVDYDLTQLRKQPSEVQTKLLYWIKALWQRRVHTKN
ncbi:MAG: ATP-binding cassette domain-containing protein, partial [Bacteroidetes bacterium]|nr:ATP-binding cassette domain-containing protein [Bacteroidota bacterium]